MTTFIKSNMDKDVVVCSKWKYDVTSKIPSTYECNSVGIARVESSYFVVFD